MTGYGLWIVISSLSAIALVSLIWMRGSVGLQLAACRQRRLGRGESISYGTRISLCAGCSGDRGIDLSVWPWIECSRSADQLERTTGFAPGRRQSGFVFPLQIFDGNLGGATFRRSQSR